ncbi:MAG: TcpQ domain-containing protein [Alcaligenaceae bacterium]|nr:TcpQ domain-containing protein [Alcaligenaceae bacterium]
MFRILWAGLLVIGLGACAQMPDWRWSKGFGNLDGTLGARAYSFDWRLSGDPQVAPLQVFDDGRRTWLQFAGDHAAPAVFRREPSGDVLLDTAREGGFLVIKGVWPHLVLRGGHLVAHVRQGPATDPAPTAAAVVPPVALAAVEASAVLDPPAPVAEMPEANDAALSDMPQDVPPGVPVMPLALESQPSSSSFQVSPVDGNLRQALVRWARSAGWTFGAAHWAVNVDIPLAGSAQFEGDFRSAVRQLLAATELGDRPLQPCFYANRVLRVVPHAQRCDRTLAPGAV